MTRIERVTSPLPRECSTTELHGLPHLLLRVLRPPRSSGAGEGNRTLVISLEGFCSTIELHPPNFTRSKTGCREADRDLVEGEGFEPSKAEPTDLQSVPVDRLGTPPIEARDYGAQRGACQMFFQFSSHNAGAG